MNKTQHPPTAEKQLRTTNATTAASYTFGYSTVGGASKGALRHQGTPEGEAAAEGGPQPEQELILPASSKPLPRVRRRHRNRTQRTFVRTVRLSEAELALITAGARACDMTLAGFLAHCALTASRDLNRTAAEVAGDREVIVELFAARRGLGRIGNNLNQVAKAMNSGAEATESRAVLEGVRRTAARLDAAVARLIVLRNTQAEPH
ncbi:MobC family plasmid mobilization relaxosome protein [Streptomyces sp. NPDC097617]|uniref:MobC family plasmid mobilization relaxosome protein n=1 Tax=Streptomyces sp. NPDC097617 TaxID=3366091 RepID=UPI0037FAE553